MDENVPHPDEGVRLSAAGWAEAANCLGLLLCTSACRWVMEEMTEADRKKMLVSSTGDALAFVTFLLGRKGAAGPGDWKASERALLRLKSQVVSGDLSDPQHLREVQDTIHEALVTMGLPLPNHEVGVNGAHCRIHGATCPPPEVPAKD